MRLLPFSVPAFQQLDDLRLHLCRRPRFWEILLQLVAADRHPVQIALLLFRHDRAHHIERQPSLLTELLEPLRLRKRRRRLLTLHGIQKLRLLLRFEIR